MGSRSREVLDGIPRPRAGLEPEAWCPALPSSWLLCDLVPSLLHPWPQFPPLGKMTSEALVAPPFLDPELL